VKAGDRGKADHSPGVGEKMELPIVTFQERKGKYVLCKRKNPVGKNHREKKKDPKKKRLGAPRFIGRAPKK